jgi:hypothetical protein
MSEARSIELKACPIPHTHQRLRQAPLANAYGLNSSRGVLDINVPDNFVASYILMTPQIRMATPLIIEAFVAMGEETKAVCPRLTEIRSTE